MYSDGTKIYGPHIRIFKEGVPFTVPAAGTCGKAALPGDDDTGWVTIPVQNFEIEPKSDSIEVFRPSPGVRRLEDVIEVKPELTIKFSTDEVNRTVLEHALRTVPITEASITVTPLSGGTKKVWLEFTVYNQSDEQELIMYAWCALKQDGTVKIDDKVVETNFVARVLNSPLNTLNFVLV